MKTMKYAPPKADMKRGPSGPAPKRENTLWDSHIARSHAQKGAIPTVAVTVEARGEFVTLKREYTLEEGPIVNALYREAMNRSACRQGTVLKRAYLAQRAQEQALPEVGKASPCFMVEFNRKEAELPAARHHGAA